MVRYRFDIHVIQWQLWWTTGLRSLALNLR